MARFLDSQPVAAARLPRALAVTEREETELNKTHRFAGLVPEMLVRSIRDDRCVLFVGAGLSAQAKRSEGTSLPTWRALLERMIDWFAVRRVERRAEPSDFFATFCLT